MVCISGSHIYLPLRKFWGLHMGAVGDSIILTNDIAFLGNQSLKYWKNVVSAKHQEPKTQGYGIISQMNGILLPTFSSRQISVLACNRITAFFIIVSPNKLTSQTIIHTVYRLSMAGSLRIPFSRLSCPTVFIPCHRFFCSGGNNSDVKGL